LQFRRLKQTSKLSILKSNFFKNIRHRLKVSDKKILASFPDIEQFLEKDIVTGSFLDKITSQYLQAAELPHFELIINDTSSLLDDLKKDE
jgi:hypothetical protein